MRFWDTSALVPIAVVEPKKTPMVRRWMSEDADVVVWTLTRVEILSAIARKRRALPAAAPLLLAARRELLAVWERCAEIESVDLVRRHAERLVERHPLRAGDALQIAAALVAARDDPAALIFVTLDASQADAAAAEGFHVLGP